MATRAVRCGVPLASHFRRFASQAAAAAASSGSGASSATAGATATAGTTLPPPRHRIVRTAWKDVLPDQAPKLFRIRQGEAMGQLQLDDLATLTPRTVPKSAKEFVLARRAYQNKLSEIRKGFKAEWEDRRAAELAEATRIREKIEADKAVRREKKAARRAENLLKQEALHRAQQEALAAKQAVSSAKRAAYFEAVRRKRVAWLQALHLDSKNWIAEDEIDQKITPEVFTMKTPWHLESWYKNREGADEEMDPAFDSDWDSDLEDDNAKNWQPDAKATEGSGLQLRELYAQKRLSDIAEDMRQVEFEFYKQHADKIEADVLQGLLADKNIDDVLAERAKKAAAGEELSATAAAPAAPADDDAVKVQ